MENTIFDDDDSEVPKTDSRGNIIQPGSVYDVEPPQEKVNPVTPAIILPDDAPTWQKRDLPQCQAWRLERRNSVLDALNHMSREDREKAIPDWIVHSYSAMRERPVLESLSADPDGADLIRDKCKAIGLTTKLEKALADRKRATRKESASLHEIATEGWANAINSLPIPFEEDGQTAAEFGKYTDPNSRDDWEEMRSRLNAEYAVVRDGGKVRILHHTKDAITYLTIEDFKHTLMPFAFTRMGKTISAAQDWLSLT